MPIVTTNFIRGRMNKSVDERLLPPGEYVDAMNLRLGSTETTEVGAVENSRGNTQLTTLSFENINLTTAATCIGAYQDSANETLYWFVHDPNYTTGGKVKPLDLILSYNTNANTLRYHVISFTVLNFNPLYLMTAVEKIEDLLFFSDNFNPPRKINITQSYDFPVGQVDQIVDEDLNVIVKPPGYEFEPGVTPTADIPLPAPTFVGLQLPGSENYIEDRFLSFAYRYRYENNEYSATSLFSNPAFATNPFKFSVKNYNNEGMQNRFNAVDVSFNTGSERVLEVDLLFKDSSTNNIYVIERFNKLEQGWADNSVHTFQFNNSKIYSVLGSDELLRLYDNVPKKAQALTIMGNRLIYGNYVDGYNITNENDQKIAIDYSTELVTKNVGFEQLPEPSIANGDNYTIDPNNTITATNAKAQIDLTDVATKLKKNSVLSISLLLESAQIGGTTGEPCFQDNINFGQGTINFDISITLQQDYATVYDFSQSSDFRNAIGTQQGVNFQPMASASQGGSLTDKFNNDLALPSITCTFTKVISSIDSSTAQQGFRITAAPGSNIIGLQTLAMKFESAGSAGPPVVNQTDLYEYFRVVSADVVFSTASFTGSLHSNRDFATGIVYLDEYGRASTVLTSNFNTISIPTANSITLNSIKATVENYAPSWAQRYKFVVKPSKGNYETIFSNFYYSVQTSQVTYFKLEGDNQNKVKTGDTLIVKTDVGGPITEVVKAKVLNVEGQAKNFLNDAQGMGVGTTQLPGLYMEIKPSGFNVNIPDDAVVDNGEKKTTGTGNDGTCKHGVNYPLFTTDAGVTTNYDIPAGSAIDINIRVSRPGRGSKCEEYNWKWNQTLFSSADYPDFRRWWIGDQVNASNASPGEVAAQGSIDVVFKTALGSYSAGVPGVTCTDNSGATMGNNTIFFQFVQDTPNDPTSPLGLVVKTKKQGCSGFQPFSRRRNVSVRCEIVVTRANSMIVFESEPVDASAGIFFDASDSYPVIRDATTGNYFHQAPTTDGDQNQTATQPAIVTLPFIDCFTFGNGVESFKIKDDLAGRALKMGQRSLAVSEQDFKEAHRFADLTYSGVFSNNAGVNNLNEFNLGLANFKELETSFGPIQKLYARETDILTLQEDKISYVLASKNLISDATGGGAIVSSPTILGTQIARTEEYGISFNPESFAVYGDSYYFTDTKRVGVIRLVGNSQNDQLEVISDKGMRSWFRDNFQLALGTQKLGGYDPYMDEFVLSTNDKLVPIPPVIYECGSEFQASSTSPQTYTIEFGTIIGDIVVDFTVTGSATFQITWSGNTVSSGVQTNTTSSITISKTTNTPTTAVVTVTPSGGSASWTVQPKCVPPLNITVFKCVINSNIDSGELIHVEYGWSDSQTISPIDTDQITMGSNPQVFSYFQSQTGVRSVGVYPYNGASLNMRINKMATDTYDYKFPNDNFKFLSTNTLYANTISDVSTLLGLASTIPNGFVTNPTGTNIREATVTPATNPAFTLPTNQQYLYLIYDFRFTAAQNLCYSDTSASEACCDCTIPCNSFQASTVQVTQTVACNQPLSQTFYYAGSGGLALYDLVYSDAACAGNAPGQGINNLPAGYYKITGNEYIRVNNLGMVIEKASC
mgnify:FL=1